MQGTAARAVRRGLARDDEGGRRVPGRGQPAGRLVGHGGPHAVAEQDGGAFGAGRRLAEQVGPDRVGQLAHDGHRRLRVPVLASRVLHRGDLDVPRSVEAPQPVRAGPAPRVREAHQPGAGLRPYGEGPQAGPGGGGGHSAHSAPSSYSSVPGAPAAGCSRSISAPMAATVGARST